MTYTLGEKILVDGKRSGTIAGPAVTVQTTKGEIRPCYPVELDEGFYNAGETLWTSILLVNETNLSKKENGNEASKSADGKRDCDGSGDAENADPRPDQGSDGAPPSNSVFWEADIVV